MRFSSGLAALFLLVDFHALVGLYVFNAAINVDVCVYGLAT